MSTQKPFCWRAILGCTLMGGLVGGCLIAIAPPPAQAGLLDWLRQITSPSTTRGTASGRSRGGAIRGNCASVNVPTGSVKELVALIPKNNIGATTSALPTFWFYLPNYQFQSKDKPKPVRVERGLLALLDDRGQPVLKQPLLVTLPEQAGFARLTLPSDAAVWVNGKGLELGKRYNWFFSVRCDAQQPAKDPSVRGWIERVSSPAKLTEQLGKTPEPERYGLYIQHQIWFEGFTLLAEQRQAASESWAEVLKNLDLAPAVKAPIAVLQPVKDQK
jgi:hypothetical protein